MKMKYLSPRFRSKRLGIAVEGMGFPIHHFECPVCGNLDAGCMLMEDEDASEKRYYRKVIGMYQGTRGFK